MVDESLNEFRLTPAAQSDLAAIWRYSAETWNVAAAEKYIAIFEDCIHQLLFMPTMARERMEFTPPIRIHPCGEHLIVYKIEPDFLAILRVLGAQQNWQRILRALDD